MHIRVSVVIPARNESGTIAAIVSELLRHPAVAEIIVVDSASDDDTGALAAAAGARVLRLEEPGFGRAVKAGFAIAQCPWVFKLDGDMRNVSVDWLSRHLEKIRPSVGLIKAWWDNSEDPMPVTNLVVKPAISLMLPELSFIRMPISGIYLCNRELFHGQALSDDYTHDLDLLVRIHRSGAEIEQVYLGEVLDCLKPVHNYFGMAGDLLRCIRSHSHVRSNSPLMVVMAHADDAEIWCGGTLLKVLNAGGIAELWIATGDAERQAEAKQIEALYSNVRVHFLDEAEFELLGTAATISRLAAAMERLQPQILITHHPDDDHPDHRACYDLVSGACLKIPRALLPASFYLANSYFQSAGRSRFAPNTFIDISDESELKYRLISLHESQEPEHWIGMSRAMDALNGAKCGVQRAEAFEKTSLYGLPRASSLPMG